MPLGEWLLGFTSELLLLSLAVIFGPTLVVGLLQVFFEWFSKWTFGEDR